MKTEDEVRKEIDRLDTFLKLDKPQTFGLVTEHDLDEMMAARNALKWVVRE